MQQRVDITDLGTGIPLIVMIRSFTTGHSGHMAVITADPVSLAQSSFDYKVI